MRVKSCKKKVFKVKHGGINYKNERKQLVNTYYAPGTFRPTKAEGAQSLSLHLPGGILAF